MLKMKKNEKNFFFFFFFFFFLDKQLEFPFNIYKVYINIHIHFNNSIN